MKRRIVSIILVALLLSSCVGANAADAGTSEPPVYSEITYYPDGSYCVTSIYVDDVLSSKSDTQTVSGHKNLDRYNVSGTLVFTLTVHGSFEYDQKTATATSASYTYQIHQSGWSLKSGGASYSGATATATATFKKFLSADIQTSVSLTCSPTGVLS